MINKVIAYFLISIVVLVIKPEVFGQKSPKTLEQLPKKSSELYKKVQAETNKRNYAEAIILLDKLIKNEPDFVDGYLRKAGIFYTQKNFKEAIELLSFSINNYPNYDNEMYFSRGLIHFEDRNYALAKLDFENFLDFEKLNKVRIDKAENFKKIASFRDSLVSNPIPFEYKKLGHGVNTFYSEYSPSISIDGQKLVFTRRINDQEDLYISEKDSLGNFDVATPLTNLNTIRNEGAHCISADGNIIIFTGCDRDPLFRGCDLYYSIFKDGDWTKPSNIGKTINSPAWESQPNLSPDGTKLFFTSNRIEGMGGKDIWYTYKNEKDNWVLPINLGPEINTPADDETPFLHPDGQTLYWRSNGRLGMGDFDIYFSRWNDTLQVWGPAQNLGYPINTEGNEGALVVSLDGRTAYFASDLEYIDNRKAANLDIYTFQMPAFARPKPTTYVKVNVFDGLTKIPLQAEVSIFKLNDNRRLYLKSTNSQGELLTSLVKGIAYSFHVAKPGYVFYNDHFDLHKSTDDTKPFELDIFLTPITSIVKAEKQAPVILKNIFFETGSSVLLETSNQEIEQLYQLLLSNKNLKIRLIGHTDNTGSEANNELLSQARAKAVYQKLIDKSIDPNQLSYEGKGSTQPIDTNDTVEGRKKNRRTEFIIVYE